VPEHVLRELAAVDAAEAAASAAATRRGFATDADLKALRECATRRTTLSALLKEMLPVGGTPTVATAANPVNPTTTATDAKDATTTDPTTTAEKPLSWSELGDAKRAILTVLNRSTERLQGRGVAEKTAARYKTGALRHHFRALQSWRYIDKAKDGYAITSAGRALISHESV
jgi:hypothetical protein